MRALIGRELCCINERSTVLTLSVQSVSFTKKCKKTVLENRTDAYGSLSACCIAEQSTIKAILFVK